MQGSNKKYPEPETGTDPVLTNMKFCKIITKAWIAFQARIFTSLKPTIHSEPHQRATWQNWVLLWKNVFELILPTSLMFSYPRCYG